MRKDIYSIGRGIRAERAIRLRGRQRLTERGSLLRWANTAPTTRHGQINERVKRMLLTTEEVHKISHCKACYFFFDDSFDDVDLYVAGVFPFSSVFMTSSGLNRARRPAASSSIIMAASSGSASKFMSPLDAIYAPVTVVISVAPTASDHGEMSNLAQQIRLECCLTHPAQQLMKQ